MYSCYYYVYIILYINRIGYYGIQFFFYSYDYYRSFAVFQAISFFGLVKLENSEWLTGLSFVRILEYEVAVWNGLMKGKHYNWVLNV